MRTKSYKHLSEKELYNSFRAYEQQVESDVKEGVLNQQQARALITSARNGYKKQNYNRDIDKINEN